MLKPIHLRLFEKEVMKAKKWGKDLGKFKEVMKLLAAEESFPLKNRNHKLKGDYNGYWECHIEPDWLLVYKKTDEHIISAVFNGQLEHWHLDTFRLLPQVEPSPIMEKFYVTFAFNFLGEVDGLKINTPEGTSFIKKNVND